MILGSAHVAVCVPDVEDAVEWYSQKLGLKVLSPPFLMKGDAIDRDMGELLPAPVVLKAAILGSESDDHVFELIEYPTVQPPDKPSDPRPRITSVGPTHVGLLCDDIEATRAELEDRGVAFLTSGMASVAGLKTTWFSDPWGSVFILMEKGDADRPYYRQF